METRSKARAAQLQAPSESILKDPGSRSPTEAEDLGLAAMMGDGEAPIVGGGQPEVRATTSSLGDIPAATEWSPAREQAVGYSTPPPSTMELELPATISMPMASERIPTLTSCRDTVEARIPTLAYASDRIPTLISSGPGAQAGLRDWPSRVSELDPTRPTVNAYSDDDDYDAMY